MTTTGCENCDHGWVTRTDEQGHLLAHPCQSCRPKEWRYWHDRRGEPVIGGPARRATPVEETRRDLL